MCEPQNIPKPKNFPTKTYSEIIELYYDEYNKIKK